ncbi:MAG TPA: DUF899 family protein [Blastocatellia bacterium]|jgi:predicted dithiol-disulfide oxidoreductase (DUF899 family)|nr:DUF899 family protein [Blastocatellia bacterium]
MAPLRFPNETTGYREARDGLLKAEIELVAQIERVAAMRRGLPPGGVLKEDYAFEEIAADGQLRTVKLSELFEGSKTSLFVYSFMYGPKMENPCVMCSSILDGLNGNARHITQRVNLAVVARSPIERILAFAKPRGWNSLRLLSSAKNSYNADYFGETAEGDQYPMANVFVRKGDLINHFWGTDMLYADLDREPRHMDLMWPLWNVLDTTPEGRGQDWYPPLNA